jgi:hypothetical protein
MAMDSTVGPAESGHLRPAESAGWWPVLRRKAEPCLTWISRACRMFLPSASQLRIPTPLSITTIKITSNSHLFRFRLDSYRLAPPISILVPKESRKEPEPAAQPAFKMPGLVSATGVLGFLADEEPDLKIFALQTLNDDIDTVWTEVAGSLSQM